MRLYASDVREPQQKLRLKSKVLAKKTKFLLWRSGAFTGLLIVVVMVSTGKTFCSFVPQELVISRLIESL